MFLKIDFMPLQSEAMSGRVEREGKKPYCIWPLPGVQLVEAQRKNRGTTRDIPSPFSALAVFVLPPTDGKPGEG